MPETRPLIDKAVRSILARQLPDGGFNIYVQGPSEVSASVKAYFALKLAGMPVDDPRMVRLRDRILELGGIQAANSYVKVNLSLFDQYPRQYCPSIPPEVVLLPFNFLYQMSAWTRAIVVSLSIVHAANPRRPVPAGFNLDEIWLPGVSPEFHKDDRWFTWHNFFLLTDRLLKWWERSGLEGRPAPGRGEGQGVDDRAHALLRRAGRDLSADDVFGDGAGCAWVTRRTIRCAWKRCASSTSLMVDDGDRFFFQPCFSPVWDTAHRRLRAGAERPPQPGSAARGRLAAGARGSPQGRLVREAAQYRAFRLGVLLQQRISIRTSTTPPW